MNNRGMDVDVDVDVDVDIDVDADIDVNVEIDRGEKLGMIYSDSDSFWQVSVTYCGKPRTYLN